MKYFLILILYNSKFSYKYYGNQIKGALVNKLHYSNFFKNDNTKWENIIKINTNIIKYSKHFSLDGNSYIGWYKERKDYLTYFFLLLFIFTITSLIFLHFINFKKNENNKEISNEKFISQEQQIIETMNPYFNESYKKNILNLDIKEIENNIETFNEQIKTLESNSNNSMSDEKDFIKRNNIFIRNINKN